LTEVGLETKKRMPEDGRGRREQRFYGVGFDLEGRRIKARTYKLLK
jgi:hypothetical protein